MQKLLLYKLEYLLDIIGVLEEREGNSQKYQILTVSKLRKKLKVIRKTQMNIYNVTMAKINSKANFQSQG